MEKAKSSSKETGQGIEVPSWWWDYKSRPDIGTVKQADSGSSMPQFARKAKKESKVVVVPGEVTHAKTIKKEANKITSRVRFKEGTGPTSADSTGSKGSRFSVVLLQEGLGNFGDCYYYTRESLDSAVQSFEGKKCYANHPDKISEQTLPERSVKDILGHFENVQVVEQDGRSNLCGELVIVEGEHFEWASRLMSHSLEYAAKYPDQEFIGLSINAYGDAEEQDIAAFLQSQNLHPSIKEKVLQAQAEGNNTIRLVKQISDAVSCDLVTEAGAGGKVLNLLEGEAMAKKEQEKKKENENEKKHEAEGEACKKENEKKHEGLEKHHENEGEEPVAKGEDTPDDDHQDAEQDMELIKSMLDKYLGEPEHDGAVVQHAHEAYQAAIESGMEGKEAMETVGHAMKMADIMAAKQAKHGAPAPAAKHDDKPANPAPDAEEEPEEADDMPAPEDSHAKAGIDMPEPKIKAAKKESSLIKLQAENAKLTEAIKAFEVEKYIDKKLSESKLPRSATKKFLEAAGKIRNEKDFDNKFKLFTEAYGVGSGEANDDMGFVFTTEKHVSDKKASAKGAFDLDACTLND